MPKSLILLTLAVAVTLIMELIGFALNTWVLGDVFNPTNKDLSEVWAGLWKICTKDFCSRLYEDSVGKQTPVLPTSPPDWYVHSQILFVVTFVCILVATCILPCYIFITIKGKRTAFTCFGINIALLLIIAAIVHGAGLLYFGIKFAKGDYLEKMEEYEQLYLLANTWPGILQRLGWGFYVSIMAWSISVFTASFFVSVHVHLKYFYM